MCFSPYILPLMANHGPISCGYPSPAQGYEDEPLDFTALLIKNPAASFCVTVQGNHLVSEGIRHGSILIIDRSIAPRARDLAVYDHNGERHVGRVPRTLKGECRVWGKITGVVTRL